MCIAPLDTFFQPKYQYFSYFSKKKINKLWVLISSASNEFGNALLMNTHFTSPALRAMKMEL